MRLRIILALILAFAATNAWAQEIEPTASELRIMQGFPPPKDKRVNDTNWTIYPFNRWAFQNVQRFQPTGMLDNGPEERPWIKHKAPLSILNITMPDNQQFTLDALLELYNTDAIVVIHNDKLVYEKYWNGMTPETPHWLASTSKSVVGTAAGILIAQGKIDPAKKVEEYIPELKESGFAGATIDQLLDMTAGTAWDESMEELLNTDSFARQYGAASGSWRIPGVESSGVFDFLPSIKKDREHGKSFVYNTPQVDLLGWILSRVTGKRLEEIVSELFWSAIGAESPAYYLLDTAGFAWATGGISATAHDLAKFGNLVLHEGKLNGRIIFPANVVKDIRENGDKKTFAVGSHGDLYPKGAYRKYWWIKNNEDGVFMGKGIYGQYIYINPQKNVVIVRFASEKVSADRQRMKRIESAFDQIATYLSM